jgi:hypothetical protein
VPSLPRPAAAGAWPLERIENKELKMEDVRAIFQVNIGQQVVLNVLGEKCRIVDK